jgi:hypothetical protein
MKKTTNIKSKKFYDEAENMQSGWGKYLKSIDILKDKVDNHVDITLNDFCWTLYGNGESYSTWESFKEYCINQLNYKKKNGI